MDNTNFFYVGTTEDAIWLMELSTDTGAIRNAAKFTGLKRPTYQVISKNNRFLYSVNESAEAPGGVSAFQVSEQLDLQHINSQPAQGPGPCHIALNNTENVLLAAGYTDGTVYTYPIFENGSIGEMGSIRHHQGSSVHKERQTKPYAHCIIPLKGTDFAFAADLGIDKIITYRLNGSKLLEGTSSFVNIHPGAGPRHMTLDSKQKYMYLVNEVDNTITVLEIEKKDGTLRVLQDISTLPIGYPEVSWSSAIRISKDDSYIYASNRGHDSIAIFVRHSETGLLTLKGWIPSRGHWPRDFNINPSGDFLIVANQHSDSLFSYRLDKETGMAIYTGHSAWVEKPVCITFVNDR